MDSNSLQTRIGFASEQGRRETNDDFVAAREAETGARAVPEAVAVIADGISGPIGRGARFYNVPAGDPSLDGAATSLILRVSHTGTSDLDLGIDLESRWLKLLQIDNALR